MENKRVDCTFCGKSNIDEDVFLIIAGKDSGICDKCVELCRDIIGAKRTDNLKAINLSDTIQKTNRGEP